MLCRSSILYWTILPLINTDFNKDQNHFHFIFIRVKTLTSAHSVHVLEATDFWQNLLWIFLSVYQNTVEPCFTDTCLILSPHYYGQFALSVGKTRTFSLNSTCLIRTPVNADNVHLFLVQSTNSYNKLTSLIWAPMLLSTVFCNNLFFMIKTFSWHSQCLC